VRIDVNFVPISVRRSPQIPDLDKPIVGQPPLLIGQR